MQRGTKHASQDIADYILGLGSLEDEERENPDLILTPTREDALGQWREDPTGWSLLTAKDPDTGEPIIKTIDQRDKARPVKGFPAHLDYLHYLVDLLYHEEHGVIEKASQMVVTTTIALASAIRCAINPGFKVLLSKHSEDEAEIILDEKVRQPWSLMPGWLRRQLPIDMKPANTVTFHPKAAVPSVFMGLPENAAMAKARGQTSSLSLIDEAEFQEMLRNLITAMEPRCAQLWLWSTPSTGGDGVTIFREYVGVNDPVVLSKHPDLWRLRKTYSKVAGMSVRRNEERLYTVVRIEHTADPSKRGEEWERKAAAGYPSTADFRREMKIDRSTNAGKLFYPQFAERPAHYIVKCMAIPRGIPILRGWDFGGANPACVWGAWSPKSRRFWILRELLGDNIDTYAFRDLVKYLSGQCSRQTLEQHPDAVRMLEENIKAMKPYPPHPWFAGAHKFYDFTGHEGLMTGRGLTKKGEARTAQEILALGDVCLYAQYTLQKSRAEVINGLSRTRDDGRPGLLYDPAVALLIRGMFEYIVYAKATKEHPDPNEPAKDAVYSHLHEALGYVLVNAVRLEDADFFRASVGEDGQPIMPQHDEQISSYLLDGR